MPSTDARTDMPAGRRTVLSRTSIARLALGWGAVLVASLTAPLLRPPVPAPLLIGALLVIIAVILLCAFGVVHEAEALARRLGDPYGTLILTLSIVVIEVVLIASVLLGPGDHTTIARDSVMAVAMIIMNLVVGVCLVVAGLRYGTLAPNRVGTSAYLVMLVALTATGFALPGAIGTDGAFGPGQAIVVAALTIGLYGVFLWRQIGARAADFREAPGMPPAGSPAFGSPAAGSGQDESGDGRAPVGRVIAEHRGELLARAVLLVATVLPIVLLAQHMAVLLDDGLGRLGAPVALAGVLIAFIVFTPETLTAVRAARGGELQRVVNLCHGALVSTVGLTIPTVLVIALLTGQRVVFAETSANLLLLGATLAVSAITASSPRAGTIHGAVHLMLFGVYALALFA